MGGNLSRWTIVYFAVALAWLVAAEIMMLAGFGFPDADILSPETLVLVHVVVVGWLSLAMSGALLQFVPVLVSGPLYSTRMALPALIFLVIGLITLLSGFLALGGHLPPWLWLVPLGALGLITGFALVVGNLGLTLWRARPLAPSARFVASGLASLCATMLFGAIFALALGGGSFGALFAASVEPGLPIHVIAGLGGWMTLTAIGVSHRLLSMFMLAPDVAPRRSWWTWFAGSTTIAIAVVGGAVTTVLTQFVDPLLSVVMLGAGLTLISAAHDVIMLYRRRKRGLLELNTRMTAWAFVALYLSAAIAAALVLSGGLSRPIGALLFLFVFGWLSGLIVANLYKIVAFLTWIEVYGPVMGKVATPRVQDLVDERRAIRWFVLYFAAVLGAAAMLAVESPSLFRVAAGALLVATLGLAGELIRTRRLSDVDEKKRLPAGVVMPRLLLCRVQ